MYHVHVPPDGSSAVERRRAAEVARRTRIFNPRSRVIGLDVHALDQQVAERREREQRERERQAACDALSSRSDQKLAEQQREEEERGRRLERELVQYRALYQRSADSRRAHVNDQHKGRPGLGASPPESPGPASMSVFEGEGGGEQERRKLQTRQNERTLRTQREEQEKWRKEQKHKEFLNGLELIQQDQRAVHLDALEEECKKAALVALKSYNLAQAEERQERERQDKQKRADLDLAEVLCMVTSDLLTECPEAALKERTGSAHRVIPDRWKGMSPKQLSAIRRQREGQCAERERHRRLEEQRNLEQDLRQLEQARRQEEEDRIVTDMERQRRAQLDRFNQQLAREQQAHQQYLNKELYTNWPAGRYFSQFNTSSR